MTRQLAEPNKIIWNAYRRHLQINRRSPETISSYFEAIYNADRFFGSETSSQGSDLTRLTKMDIREYVASRLETMAPKSVATFYVALRAFYNWLVAEGIISTSPMDGTSKPPVPQTPVPVIAETDLKALLRACQGKTFLDRRDEALIRVMCEPGGPRRAEVTGMTLDAIDDTNEVIRIVGKGNKIRYIPMGAKTGQALFKYLHARNKHRHAGCKELWLTKQGPISLGTLSAILARRCEKAGIERVRPHQMRHTSASRAMASGISDLDMMTLFGWSTPQMLSVYGAATRTQRALASARTKGLGDLI